MPNQASVPNYSGKTVLILGLDKSTLALGKRLHAQGARLRVNDLRAREQLADLEKDLTALTPSVEMEFGKYAPQFFDGNQLVLWASSLPMDHKLLDELRAKGAALSSDIDFILAANKVPVIGIFGSEGKTTTAFLLRELLQAAGAKRVFFAGDQGSLATELLEKQDAYDYAIVEFSFLKLESAQQLKLHALMFLNLHAPFPDRFSRADDCLRVLQNAVRGATKDTIVVYNHKETALRTLLVPVQAHKFVFRRKDPLTVSPDLVKVYRGAYLQGSREVVWLENNTKTVLNLGQAPLFGLYNRDNFMAALCMAKALGVSLADVQKNLDNLAGAPHRLELVKKKGGVRFVNDSRATTVEGLRKSLDAFPLEGIILIAGGRDTQADFTGLADTVKQRVKTMILIGEAKEHINRCVGDHTETFLVGTFEEAILLSYQKSRESDIILLSPGCDSYDMFKTYEERGDYFKRYVTEL